MSNIIPAYCPDCNMYNPLDIDKYPPDQKIGLFTLCIECQEIFGFDLEYLLVATPFRVKNSKVQ